MAGTRRLNDLLAAANQGLSPPDGRLVVALSGGADSAALAYLVVSAGREVRGVHVDHGLTHSPTMRRAALAIAARLGIDLEVTEVGVPAGPSPEGQARSARYQALSGAIRPGESLMTAHTADDNAETVLINLVRGTGTRGLAGIPPYRPIGIHRPMLGLRRSLAREIAFLAGLEFVDDPMNLDPALTRNYLRAEVMPGLGAINPDLVGAIGRMSAAARADADYLDGLAERHRLDFGGDVMRVVVGDLISAPPPVADRVLMRMLRHVAGGAGVSAGRVGKIREVLEGGVERTQVVGQISCWREGPFLVVGATPSIGLEAAALEVGETGHGGLVFEVLRREGICRVAPLSRWHAIFPPDTVLMVEADGVVQADGEPAWHPGEKRLPVAWYHPGSSGYLSVFAREESGWTSSP